MNRPRFIAVLAILAAISVVLAACGGGSKDKSSDSPQTVLDEATLQGIESGHLDLTLESQLRGKEGGSIDASLSGSFQGEGKGKLPLLDMDAKANGAVGGKNIDFNGGLVLLPNSAYVNYEGTEYEVDPTTFSIVESTLQQAQRESGEGDTGGASACQEELGKLKVADFFENAVNKGRSEIGGTTTTEITGNLNIPNAIDSALEVAESPACKGQLAAAGPLPSKAEIEKAKKEVEDTISGSRVVVQVGDDNIVRQIAVQMKLIPKNGGSGPRIIEIEFALELTELNEEQTISAPPNAEPLSKLFLKLGINPIELLGLLQGEESGKSLGELFEGLAESQTH